MDPPRFLTFEQMRLGGPQLSEKTVLVLVADQIYRRENDGWYLLDDRPLPAEVSDGPA
jgi:hypothetical protein